MSGKTECPNCKIIFAVKTNLKYRLQANLSFFKLIADNIALPWNKGLEEIHKAHLVVCPNCKHEFSTSEYRYFGVLKINHFRICLIVFLLLFIFVPMAVLIRDIMK
jgi:hypothetical protein